MKYILTLTFIATLSFLTACNAGDDSSSEATIEVTVDDEGATEKEGVTIEVTTDENSEVASAEHVHTDSCNEGTHNCGEHCGCGEGCKCTVDDACSSKCTPKQS